MTATAGSQVFGPWYDVIGAVLISGMFFYLAFAQASFPLSTRQRWPAFVSKRFCIVFGVGGAIMAVANMANMPAATAKVAVGPQWSLIHADTNGDIVLIDLAALVRNGHMVSYSELTGFKTPKSFPLPMGSVEWVKRRLLVNCADRTHVVQEVTMLRSDGSTVSPDQTGALPVMPASANMGSLENKSPDFVCGPRQ